MPLALVAIGLPAALRAAFGRPRSLPAAWIASLAAAALAQALGELLGWRAGILGDAQVLAALGGATLASLVAIRLERTPSRSNRRR
ncbi:MAG: hypothetical protein HY071_06535 [Chloroflexi bacterium]|nr:hypothetical protein [Chloroflexota bacterium]